MSGRGYFSAAPRPIAAEDAEGARALIGASLAGTAYLQRTAELLDDALAGDPETVAIVIERDGTVAALALLGPVAASAAWKLDMLLVAADVHLREIGGTITDAAIQYARSAGAHMLVAELPADAAIGRTLTLLRANGFRQEGRIADFFRDGVAMLFLRRDIQLPP